MGDPGERLDRSWVENADAWTDAVRDGRIESRELVTDQAVIDAVLACSGSTVLDVGCGEGWLSRRLSALDRVVTGFDGSAPLIERAVELGSATFLAVDYDAFIADPDSVGWNFDVAVANFSILGDPIVPLLSALRTVVVAQGALVIQTVHQDNVDGDVARDGWREETFERLAPLGFSAMPWFYRTSDSWVSDLKLSGWSDVRLVEKRHPGTGLGLSRIFIGRN